MHPDPLLRRRLWFWSCTDVLRPLAQKKDPVAMMKALKAEQNAKDQGSPRLGAGSVSEADDDGASAYAGAHHQEVNFISPAFTYLMLLLAIVDFFWSERLTHCARCGNSDW